MLNLGLHLRKHCRVLVLAPDAPGIPRRLDWSGITVLRYTYFLPRALQHITRGEGTLANLRHSRLARLQLPLLVGSQCLHLPLIVRKYKVDLVNSHWIVPQGFNYAVWRPILGIPHVVTCHSAGVFLLQRMPLGRRVARFIVRHTDRFLPVSTDLARCLEELSGSPIPHRVVPMGVDTASFRSDIDPRAVRARYAPSGERMLLFVGKLVPKKGIEFLLQAVHRLGSEVDPWHLVVVGGGPLEAEIRSRIVTSTLSTRVTMTGWLSNDELPAYYAAADAVCVPSIVDAHGETEGMPVVVQEALASGCILIATTVGGIPDVVSDGVSGILVPEKDPDALADAIRGALSMDARPRQAMQERAACAARANTWEKVAASYSETFDELLDNPAHTVRA
ncbi:glycosyltransferase [Planctomycetota bacterium]